MRSLLSLAVIPLGIAHNTEPEVHGEFFNSIVTTEIKINSGNVAGEYVGELIGTGYVYLVTLACIARELVNKHVCMK